MLAGLYSIVVCQTKKPSSLAERLFVFDDSCFFMSFYGDKRYYHLSIYLPRMTPTLLPK